jgi:hypothetical protein
MVFQISLQMVNMQVHAHARDATMFACLHVNLVLNDNWKEVGLIITELAKGVGIKTYAANPTGVRPNLEGLNWRS